MRRFFGWIATNAGTSLAFGGTVLTIGVALGAIGLAEAQASEGTPFSNGWLVAGLAVAGLATIWVAGPILATIVATVKAEVFARLLGDALHHGQQLSHGSPTTYQLEMWEASVCDLIVAGLGTAEGELFLSDQDLGLALKSATLGGGVIRLRMRLARLSRLIDRGAPFGEPSVLP